MADALELSAAVAAAARALDGHLRDIVRWHFSKETGTPFWLDFAAREGFDAGARLRTFHDLALLPRFDGEVLRSEPHDRFIPRAYAGRPFCIFETSGTTGMPKQRLSWDDHRIDYEDFSKTLDDRAFPPGGYWLMVGPTGPRRLRLSIEHLAHHRGSSCYFVDLDPRWVKKLIRAKDFDHARAYMAHVIDQAVAILEKRKVSVLFTTPKLLEELGGRLSLAGNGIRGVFCGGTTMTPQTTRFLVEEVLEGRVAFVPTYGNTLMGLAAHQPDFAIHGWSVTYHAPEPRAVLRVCDPAAPDHLVDYDQWGRVELTTLTREFFMPRFLERDEALRRRPCSTYPWDGVGEVRPFQEPGQQIIEGVY